MPPIPDGDERRTAGTAGADPPAADTAPGASSHTMLVYSSPRRDDFAVAAWISAALQRGEKVVCRYAPGRGPRMRRMLDDAGLDTGAAGAVELMDAADVRERCRGRRDALAALHAELAGRAVRDGYTGLAMVSDAAANAVLTAGSAELVEHEQDLDRLAATGTLRALCRYHTRDDEALLPGMLAVHRRDVDDDIWAASFGDDLMRLRGEIDASNAERVAHVLEAGLAEGVRVVSLAELRFCAVAGVRMFLTAAAELAAHHGELVLMDVDPIVARNFAITGGDRHPGLRLLPLGDAR